MDTSGNIRNIEDYEWPRPNEIRISDEEAIELAIKSKKYRKNWMRNRRCVCGSGKKFKKCCWSKFAMAGIKN